MENADILLHINSKTTATKLPEYVQHLAAKIEPVGSRVTCSPPVLNTDEDFLILAKRQYSKSDVFDLLNLDEGWDFGGSIIRGFDPRAHIDETFHSYTRDNVNLIITWSDAFFRRFMAATSVATRLNLLDKRDRIALFQAVLYGQKYGTV